MSHLHQNEQNAMAAFSFGGLSIHHRVVLCGLTSEMSNRVFTAAFSRITRNSEAKALKVLMVTGSGSDKSVVKNSSYLLSGF